MVAATRSEPNFVAATDAAPIIADESAPSRWRGALVFDRGHGRSSRLVTLMKLFLPATAAALIGLIVAWPQLKTEDGRFRVGTTHINTGDADVVRMVNARLHGSDGLGRPYVITAASATQPTANAAIVLMEEPKADITLQDGTWIAATAPAGVFHRDRHQVTLTGGVNLFHDQGYELRTASAEIDMKAGAASGNQRVEGQGPFGQIQSEGFRVLDRGHRLIFTGKSQLVLQSGANTAANQAAGQARSNSAPKAAAPPVPAQKPVKP